MSYREALERLKKVQDAPGDVLAKPTEPGFGSFVSTPDGTSKNFSANAGAAAPDEKSSKRTPDGTAKTDKTQPAGTVHPAAPCPACGCGSYWSTSYRADAAWYCESCAPPPESGSHRMLTVSGTRAPMPPPALPWPLDLTEPLKRVSTAFEWSRADVADFTRWARRSPQGLADAREFLRTEVAKLPAPGLEDRRRVVLDRLADDPAARAAWLCTDDGESDPVLLTLAIRGKGSCELAIPRARFDAFALPQLIGELAANDSQPRRPAAGNLLRNFTP